MTSNIDMTTPAGLQYAMDHIRACTGHITLWGSMPCTGGSPWQYINEKIYLRNNDVASLQKLQGHRTLFRKLFWSFMDLSKEVLKRGGIVCMEWPTPCQYWRDPQVVEFLQSFGFTKSKFHGCAYGLTNAHGQPMKKPWTLATTNAIVARDVVRTCDGTHKHAIARGKDCKCAEDYTIEFAKHVHVMLKHASTSSCNMVVPLFIDACPAVPIAGCVSNAIQGSVPVCIPTIFSPPHPFSSLPHSSFPNPWRRSGPPQFVRSRRFPAVLRPLRGGSTTCLRSQTAISCTPTTSLEAAEV